MQRRDEDNLVIVLQLIIALSLQFPVRVIDEHQDARSPIAQVSISPPAKSNNRCRESSATHTVPFSMNSSSRSLSKLSRSQYRRYVTSAGFFGSSCSSDVDDADEDGAAEVEAGAGALADGTSAGISTRWDR